MTRRIWTVADYAAAVDVAADLAHATGDQAPLVTLSLHAPHAHHCGGYEVLAWPCLPAGDVVAALLGGKP